MMNHPYHRPVRKNVITSVAPKGVAQFHVEIRDAPPTDGSNRHIPPLAVPCDFVLLMSAFSQSVFLSRSILENTSFCFADSQGQWPGDGKTSHYFSFGPRSQLDRLRCDPWCILVCWLASLDRSPR
jgi:hypothetical protein